MKFQSKLAHLGVNCLVCAFTAFCSLAYGQSFYAKDIGDQLNALRFTNLVTEDSAQVYFVLADKEGLWSFGGKHVEARIYVSQQQLLANEGAFIDFQPKEKLDHIKPMFIDHKRDSLLVFATQKLKTSKSASAFLYVIPKNQGQMRQIALSNIAFRDKDPEKEANYSFAKYNVHGRNYYLFMRNHQADWGLARFIDLKLFDQDFSLIYANTEIFPYNSMDCEVMSVSMNGLGELVFLLRLEADLGQYAYRVFVLNPATSASFSFPLENKEWQYTSVSVASSKKGNVLFYGTAKNKLVKDGQVMVFGTLFSTDTRSVQQDKCWKLGDGKFDKSNELSNRDLVPESAVFMSDSVYWVSCQLKKKRTSTITDGQGKVYLQYQFRWEDVLCFSNAAEIQSKLPLRLPVRQESRADETGLGVATYAFGNSIFFALNGHPKSYGLALQDHKKVFSGSGCPFLVGFQVDSGVMQSFWPDKQYLNVLEGLEPRLFYPSPPKRWYFASGTVFGAIEVAP